MKSARLTSGGSGKVQTSVSPAALFHRHAYAQMCAIKSDKIFKSYTVFVIKYLYTHAVNPEQCLLRWLQIRLAHATSAPSSKKSVSGIFSSTETGKFSFIN
jgi:hypothetical protein